MTQPYNKTLDADTFQQIYTDKRLRNAVAYAHGCYTSHETGTKFKHRLALYYPISYIVTEEQIEAAKVEIQASMMRTKEEHAGKLILVGMGMVLNEKDYFGNHRARGCFINDAGEKCFVEVMNSKRKDAAERSIWFDFAFICKEDGEEKERLNADKKSWPGKRFTSENILMLINREFGSSFKEIYLDNYDLGPDEHISKVAA